MPETLISALVQAPFVLAMAFLVHRFLAHLDAHDEDWRDFTEHAYRMYSDRIDRLTAAIDQLSQLIVTHDAATRRERDLAVGQPQAPDDITARRAAADPERWPALTRRR